MALKQKTINGTNPETYDKEVGEFLTLIGEKFKNISYTSAALLITVAEKAGIQHINKQQVKTTISVVNSCYIIYEEPETDHKPLTPVK